MRYTKEFRQYVNGLPIETEYMRVFGEEPVGNIFCPFHPNSNTPAAHVYGNHIKCFVCQRNYGVFDLLQKYDPERLQQLAQQAPVMASASTPKGPTRIPAFGDLDFSNGITIQLLDSIINYGS